MTLLRVREATFAYGPIQAVTLASIDVEPGEIVTIIGSNGAGKSTLLSGIAGLMRPLSGKIFFQDVEITDLAASRRVAAGIALSPEGRQIFPDQTVRDNLMLGAYSKGYAKAEMELMIEKQFQTFPRLKERQLQLGGNLSGGEQQMLAIARALMSQPKLLLLDEPSLGLAPKLMQEIFSIVASLRRLGIGIVLVEQMANVALEIADKAYVLETSRIVLSGSGKELLNNPGVRKAYLGH